MQYPKTIKFTTAEWRLIEDRLAVPCAIADSLTDDEDVPDLDKDDIIDRARAMYFQESDVTLRDDLDRAVLEDAVAGSTMPAKLQDQIERGSPAGHREARWLKRQISKVEKRLAEIGIHVQFPKY